MTEPAAPQAPKPGPLHEVLVPGTPIAVLEPAIGTERYERLLTAAARFRDRLGRRTIWNVNSTAVGGGVAEMLQVLVGYIAGLDIAVRWMVIGGDPEFFAITKRLHTQALGITLRTTGPSVTSAGRRGNRRSPRSAGGRPPRRWACGRPAR